MPSIRDKLDETLRAWVFDEADASTIRESKFVVPMIPATTTGEVKAEAKAVVFISYFTAELAAIHRRECTIFHPLGAGHDKKNKSDFYGATLTRSEIEQLLPVPAIRSITREHYYFGA